MTSFYVGTKIVMAWHQERDGVAGYSVKYEDGYISWCPADKFDAAYACIGNVSALPPHAQRLHGERAELYARSIKLERHMTTPLFASLPGPEQERQRRQAVLMRQLLEVLTARIDAL